MICSHCGKVLDNDKLMFCVYCGYPLKGEKKGFFAKSDETGVSRAEELAADTAIPEVPTLDNPVHPAPAAMQNAQQIPQPGAPSPMKAAPQMNNPQPMANPMGMQPMASPMGMQQPMQGMPGAMPQMGAQTMVPTMPGGMQQMGYGMPQMGYGMPQMQYGMPQFAGYDAAGNPIYMQMVPQFVGYDAYGSPMYNMVAMPYVMPAMQGMPGMPQMMQQQAVYPQEQVIDVPQEQIRPADAIPTMNAPQPAPAPKMQTAVHTVPQTPPPVKSVMLNTAPKPMPQPAPMPAVQPIQSVAAAAKAAQEALLALQSVNIVQDAQPVPPTPYRSAQITSVYDVPMDAATLMNEDENAPQGAMPDEKALLDSIFSNKSKNYSMSEGTKPAAATFSINVKASEITSVRDEEFGSASQAAPPPVQSLFSKPGVQINPFSGAAINNYEPQPEPEYKAPVSAEPQPAPAPKKTSKPRTEADANAAKRAAKEQKLREAKEAQEATKEPKAPKASKKNQPKKAPAKIVSPDEFFDDKPRHTGARSKSMLTVKDLDRMDDDQLEAQLTKMGASTGGKKSNRSMKAASKDEMDVSNIDVDALVGAKKSRLLN